MVGLTTTSESGIGKHFIMVKEARSKVEAEVVAIKEPIQFCLQEAGVA